MRSLGTTLTINVSRLDTNYHWILTFQIFHFYAIDFEEIRIETIQLSLDDIRHLLVGQEDKIDEEKKDEIITKLRKSYMLFLCHLQTANFRTENFRKI